MEVWGAESLKNSLIHRCKTSKSFASALHWPPHPRTFTACSAIFDAGKYLKIKALNFRSFVVSAFDVMSRIVKKRVWKYKTDKTLWLAKFVKYVNNNLRINSLLHAVANTLVFLYISLSFFLTYIFRAPVSSGIRRFSTIHLRRLNI